MQRREFLLAGLAASALASTGAAAGLSGTPLKNPGPRDLYELRAYRLKEGASPALLHTYLKDALLPALQMIGVHDVGVFTEPEAKDGQAVWVLITHHSLESVLGINAELNAGEEVRRAAGDYWVKTTKENPAYDRIDSWLLLAFSGQPRIEIPELSKKKSGRVFELRTYESFNEERALKKISMFNSGEIGAMHEVGLGPVFYGQALLGRDLPHLTYMLSGPDRATHAEHWKAFNAHPVWVKLKADPQYAETVSKITSRFLIPTDYSPL
jgi:hypothetical protein